MSTNPYCCNCVDFYQLPFVRFLLGESFHPGGLALTRELANACLINRNSRVLDIAGGDGHSARFLADNLGCQVTVVDAGEYPGRPEHVKVAHMQANILDAELMPGSYDAVLCECALCTFTNPDKVLSLARTLLKPNGFIGLSDMVLNQPLPDELLQPLTEWLCIGSAVSTEAYLQRLRQASFTQIRHRDSSHHLIGMLDDIQNKLQTLADSGLLQAQLPAQLAVARPEMLSLAALVRDGAIGYGTFIARA